MRNNKRGVLHYLVGMTGVALGGAIFSSILLATAVTTVGIGAVQTFQDGTMKKNGQTIWCKMQGKSAEVCDAKYK